jgi:hypothetical protein
MYRIIITALLIFSATGSFAQKAVQKYTVSGYVRDKATGEALIGCNVYIKELLKGSQTNTYGFYSVTFEPGNYTLVISLLGFNDFSKEIVLDKDQTLNIDLEQKAVEAAEVVIRGERPDNNVTGTEMGKLKLDVDKIKTLPAFLGEVDILKTLQLLPGVQSAGEGNSGFYVRGGGPDQNLVLLDEAVVYNASHLFGFFSVFNSDAVKNMELTKGGMPAQYGGRLASVLDISMKEGNNKEFHGSGGIGYIASRLTLEGPIKKDKASFIVSVRRTFIDLFLREPFVKEGSRAEGNSYYFYDLNTKINYTISQKDRLFISGYFGRDVFNFRSRETGFTVRIPWGNATTSVRWNHLFSDKLFLNTSLIFSDYKFEFEADQPQFNFKIFSGIRDYNAKVDFNYFPNILHNIKFGGNYIYHRFTPTNAEAKSDDVVFDLGKIVRYYAHDAAVYINDEFDLSDRFRINAGLRGSMFVHVGPFTRYIPDPVLANQFLDSVIYDRGESVKTYSRLEPRVSMRYEINSHSSVKAAFTQNYQYIHLASLASVSLPTDVWVPSTEIVKPQYSVQYATGYFHNFKNNEYEASIELYYKDMRNLIEYKEGAQPDDDVKNNTDNNFTFGKGWSYGAEFFVKKALGKFNGWVGYTLAYTKRQFDEINRGEEFSAKYDRRHDVSVVLTYERSSKWTFGLVWIYATGDALTMQTERYAMSSVPPLDVINGQLITGNNLYILGGYGKRNDFRQKAYHRLDLSATLHGKKHKNWQNEWNFSVFNAYYRMNPYFIYFAQDGNTQEGNLGIQAKQVSLFPIIPSVTYNFKF